MLEIAKSKDRDKKYKCMVVLPSTLFTFKKVVISHNKNSMSIIPENQAWLST